MYNEFNTFEELKEQVITDRESTGMDVSTRNRYPIRFVLFDNFRDCSQFVDFVQSEVGAIVESVDKWIDPDYPDLMITHSELALRIKEHIKQMNGGNCVIAPFSELARFYENGDKKTFDALLKTIKAIEATADAAYKHQRVYVPIVGLEGKMQSFKKDSQSNIWRLRSEDKGLTYRLILTNGETFSVKGLDSHYTVVRTVREWLNVWKDADKQVTPNIICTSKSIFANQIYAQPDNAFTFIPCHDSFEFLTKGLQLQFGGLTKVMGDGDNWNELASKIDVTNGFSFSKYVKDYFTIADIDTPETFIKLWFDNQGLYERWLIARYYQLKTNGVGLICRILTRVDKLTGNGFIEQMVLELSGMDSEIKVRSYCLKEAAKRGIPLREAVESTLYGKLRQIANTYNTSSALRYFTGISGKEKELAILWLSKGQINVEQVRDFYPDLYNYYSSAIGISVNVPDWLTKYMTEYKRAKLSDNYTPEIEEQIKTLNASEVSFDEWYQSFSTTRTLLQTRGDIEMFYWVDGLGIEWIPFIKEIIKEKCNQNIFLNEIKIARSILPSKTDVNKVDLQKLLPEGSQLIKAGDLDNLAHQSTNKWPNIIIEEIKVVRNIVEEIISKYNGKKIAIISDHGLTYLSQLVDGLGLNGVDSDHHGRVAIKNSGTWTTDGNYFRLEDGKTVCALKHNSLCNKVPKGQGIHGGCTPEETLVPVLIISSYEIGAEWNAEILTLELSGANPTVKFRITNIPSIEIPYLEYDGTRYALHQIGNDLFESDALVLNDQCAVVTLAIGNVNRDFNVSISTGAKEDDLFDF
jgi:hypothetical protein